MLQLLCQKKHLFLNKRLRGYGAKVILKGETFNDSRLYMEELAKKKE